MRQKDWAYLKLAGAIALAVVAIHGRTSRRWSELHTVGVVVSAVAAVGPLLLKD